MAVTPEGGEEDAQPDHGARIPLLRLRERQGEGAEHAAGTLEALQIGPLAVEDLGQVGVKGVAPEKPLFGRRPLPARLFVHVQDSLEGRQSVRPEGRRVDGFRGEEAAPQDLGHVLLEDGLDRLLALTAEDGVQLLGDLLAQGVALAGIGGQERGDDGAAVHLGGRVGQVLKEVGQAPPPGRVQGHLLPGVHQHLVDEDQGGQAFPRRQGEELAEEILRRGALPLLGMPFGVEEAQPVVAGDGVGEHAPGMPQPAGAPLGGPGLRALLGVELVETEGGHPRPGGAGTRCG